VSFLGFFVARTAMHRNSPPGESADELGWVGHFRILKELDRGGMGAVFLAENLNLRRSVALHSIIVTKLTAAGIAELHKALPKCAILWDDGDAETLIRANLR